MSDREVVLELVMRARDLAGGAVANLTDGLEGVATKAADVGGRVTSRFAGMGDALANAIGNSVENLSTGGDLGQTLMLAGGYMAGQLAETFGGQLIERLASSGLVAALAAPLGALGSTVGALIAAAIPVGMALLPVLLIGAIVAAITVLIVNEGIRNQVIGFAGGLVKTLIGALSSLLGALPGVLGAAFAAAWSFIVNAVLPFIVQIVGLWLSIPFRLAGLGISILQTIVGGLAGLPGAVARIVGDAFRNLKIDIGPFHVSGGGVTIDLPKIDLPHFAAGVVDFGGGLAVVGERGPEIVRLPRGSDVFPNGSGPSGGGRAGVELVGISERDLDDMIDRRMYFRIRRAAPVAGSSS